MWFGLLLPSSLASYRSEKAAFHFTAPVVSAPAPAALPEPRPPVASRAASPRTTSPEPVLPALRVGISRTSLRPATETQAARHLTRPISRGASQARPAPHAPVLAPHAPVLAPRKPRQALSATGSFLQILGTAVFVAGIVLGLVMGGWAGFGIFALGAVLGLLLAFWGSFIIDGELP